MKFQPYGIRKTWPFHYVISALRFYALEPKSLDEYLVDPFPETLFHGAGGDFHTTSPLRSILDICAEVILAGRIWNEWIGKKEWEDDELEKMFEKLCEQTTRTYCWEDKKGRIIFLDDKNDRKYRDMLLNDENHPFVLAMKSCGETATIILKFIGWYGKNESPLFSCNRLLNEWSYGAYDYNRGQSQNFVKKPNEICVIIN